MTFDEVDNFMKKTGGNINVNGVITLRDYFAAKAMASMVAQERNIIAMCAENGAREQICEDAYKVADAMIAERKKNENP